jgi:hypothetical protein
MAEIKIEKKKPIWPWIILVLVILAILYFLVFADDDDDLDEVETEQVEETTWEEEDAETTTWEDQTDTTEWDTSGGVEGYLAYISDQEKMGIDHQYTNNALIELINAVQAKADEMNFDISADMESVRQEAQAIKSDPMALTHANTIKSAGTKLANVMEKMQMEEFPNLSSDVTEVKTAAQNIEGSTPTLDQKDQVKMFFDEAGDLLKKMS